MSVEEKKYNSDSDSSIPSSSESEGEDESFVETKSPSPPPFTGSANALKKGRRGTVMAAAVIVGDSWTPPYYAKEEGETTRLHLSLSKNILFSELSASEIDIIIGAMQKVIKEKDDEIIRQGEEGDLFYVVESGLCEIFVKGVGKVMEVVNDPSSSAVEDATNNHRNFFGELALLYDAPRAATVVAAERTVLWGLDRLTFKKILQDSTQKQRSLHRKFLEQVPLLSTLSTFERLTVADALQPRSFKSGEDCVIEKSEGHEFFIIESGTVNCYKTISNVSQIVSDPLGPGDYFGELALMKDDVRAATVRAGDGGCSCLVIDRKTFKRLMGPLEDLLRGHEEVYERFDGLVIGGKGGGGEEKSGGGD